MGIIKDHSIVKLLKNREKRNNPEIIQAICTVLSCLNDDMDKTGELMVTPKTDQALEELNEAVDRFETRGDDEEEELEDLPDEDEEDIE